MYRVTVITDGIEYPLHEPRDNDGDLQLIEPVVTLEMGKNGTFEFSIAPTHPNKDKIVSLKSEVIVYRDSGILFAGRAIGDEQDFRNVGKVTCEGELAYLIDSIQRPYDITGSGQEFLRKALEVHNSQVEERKQFVIGNISVPDTAPETHRFNDQCENTLKTLKSQLADQNGGYLRVRRTGGKKHLDYVSDYGGINSQPIRFGENVLDLEDYVDPTCVITALIPYGEPIESDDLETEKRLDITSVNGGKDYIYDEEAVGKYGWIWGVQVFDGLTDPEALLSKAKAYLKDSVVPLKTVELTALDLSLVNVNVDMLQLGYWTKVISKPHGIDRQMLLTKKVINLSNPGKDKIILGSTIPTFTASTNKDQITISDRVDRVAASTSREINRKVENATQLITGGKGGYVVIGLSEDKHPEEILIMDAPTKDAAKSVIRLNKNGLGFSRTGYDGVYANAWTIDGNLVADFVTTGTMLADRIRGGKLEIGGKGLGKEGSILVMDADGKRIGSWDKTGLTILRGVLQGVSAVFGGVNNQNGAIEVLDANGRRIGRWDKDGIYIQRGELSVGPLEVFEDEIYIGDFYVSTDESNVFRSVDGSVVIQTEEGGPFGEYAVMEISTATGTTTVSDHHVETGLGIFRVFDGECILAGDSEWSGMTLFEALEWCSDMIIDLQDQIDSMGGV